MSASDIFQSKGYIPYISQDFYSKNTFIVKQGRNAEHINSTVNGKNSGWPNAAHIVLPIESRYINVISEARQGTILSYLASKFNELRNETFIYQPCVGNNNYQRFKIWLNQFNQCVITKDGEPGILNSIVPHFENEIEQPTTPLGAIVDTQKDNKISTPYSIPPSQVIYYGVPGCGKSNKIKQDFENENVDEEAQVVRCVFHPEYTNADFVGQIYPVAKKDGKGVDYKFKPGPFTEILRRAYLNPLTNFFLVIEEINRGNAAAIFGEMFQLLDRIKEGKDKSGFGPGWSSYSILNDDVNDYIRNIEAFDKFEHAGCVKPNLYKDMRDGNGDVVDAPDENGKKEIDFSTATSYSSLELTLQGFDVPQIFRESTSIRLPPNLSILATMNTSDQNVFTLDNAFQRRFDMELVRNEFEKGDVDGFKDAVVKAQHDAFIEGTDCTWGDFWEKMNDKIVSLNRGLASTEDKRLGPWFVCSVAGDSDDAPRVIPAKTFAEKVLKYLWDDAFKFKRPQFFAAGLSSLEQVVKKFEEAPVGNLEKLKAVFKEF